MSPLTRILAVLVGLVALAVTLTALVRELVLAVDETSVLPLGGWWEVLADEPAWSGTGLAVLIAVVLAALLVAAGMQQLRSRHSRPVRVVFDTDRGSASLDVPPLERALRRNLERNVPGIRITDIQLSGCDEMCRLLLTAELPAADLVGLHDRVFAAVSPALEQMAGLQVEEVDLVATRRLWPQEEA